MRLRSAVRVALLPVVVSVAAACASAPKPFRTAAQPYRAQVTIAASADVNPDASGRPSPIVVRVYQLKTDTAFGGADYFALFDNEQKVLGADLINRKEYVMAPAEQRVVEIEIDLGARFVGVLAAYRDIRNAEWRVLQPATRRDFAIAVGRARAGLTVAK